MTVGQKIQINLVQVLLILAAIIFLIPFYFVIVNSVKTFSEIVRNAAALPTTLQWNNYVLAFGQIRFTQVFINTLTVTVFSVAGMVVLGSMAGWKLARFDKKPVSIVLFSLFVASMVIPFQSVMIPMVRVAGRLGLTNSHPGLIFIYFGFGVPFGVFLYHGFVKSVPLELEESARIEGCGELRLFIQIVFPLLKTITVTFIILQTLWVWNDFLLPALLISSRNLHTIPLAINRFFSVFLNQWDRALPSLVLSTAPIVVFFLLLQRHMIRGISDGALKG